MATDFHPSELNRRDSDRIANYRRMLDFFQGGQWEARASRGQRQLTFNYARVFIEKVTSYLMTRATFAVDPANDSARAARKAAEAEAALREVYDRNNLAQLDVETEIDCAVLGDAAYKVTWDPRERRVRVTAPDVQGIFVWHGGDDIADVARVASRYQLPAETAALLYDVQPSARAVTVVETWTAARFQLWLDNRLVQDKPNPYGFIPFVVFPNQREPKKYWGISDIQQIYETQQELNRAVSQLSRILELSGNPIAVLENVNESSDIAVTPGAVWNIPEQARAYLLDLLQGGGVRMHVEYINVLYRILHDLSESPRASFGGTERDLSGVALEIELQPLVQKVHRKRLIRNHAYNRRNRMVLDLLEKYEGRTFGDVVLRTVWGPVLPQDMTKLVANERVMVEAGLHSRRTAMDTLGVKDPAAELREWLDESRVVRSALAPPVPALSPQDREKEP